MRTKEYLGYAVREDGVVFSKKFGTPLSVFKNDGGKDSVALFLDGKSLNVTVENILKKVFPKHQERPATEGVDIDKIVSDEDIFNVILSFVCAEFNISRDAIFEETRSPHIVQPRQIAMYLCGIYKKEDSVSGISRAFGKNHATVLHAEKVVKDKFLSLNKKGNPIYPSKYKSVHLLIRILDNFLERGQITEESIEQAVDRIKLQHKTAELSKKHYSFDKFIYKGYKEKTKPNIFLEIKSLQDSKNYLEEVIGEMSEEIERLQEKKNKMLYSED